MAILVLVAVYVAVDVCRKGGVSRGENRYIGRLVVLWDVTLASEEHRTCEIK